MQFRIVSQLGRCTSREMRGVLYNTLTADTRSGILYNTLTADTRSGILYDTLTADTRQVFEMSNDKQF